MLKRLFILLTILIPSSMLAACLPAIFTGATISVVELAKDRSPSEAVDDIRIATAIKTELIKKNFRKLYTRIKVEVIQGRVLYTGSVDKEEDALDAVQIAWDQKGVTEVLNELKVDKNSGNFDTVQYTRDSMITSQIKSKLFLDRSIKFINYTVITVNDTVYLFGIARSEEELEKVANIAANIRGVQKVVSHVKINETDSPAYHSHKKSNDDSLVNDDEDYDNKLSKREKDDSW